MKIKQFVMVMVVTIIGLLTINLNATTPTPSRWSWWVFWNDSREVVQWNYVHTDRIHVVIKVKTTSPKSGWLIPISSMDGPTGAVAWTPHLPMKAKRVRISSTRLAELDTLRAYYQWVVEERGEKPFDYAINHKGELVRFPGLAQ